MLLLNRPLYITSSCGDRTAKPNQLNRLTELLILIPSKDTDFSKNILYLINIVYT